MSQSSAQTLPAWPDSTRGIPNIVLRSALCAAIGKGKRAYFERELLASYKNFSILYTGQQLDQGNLGVWLMILHYARIQRVRADEAFRFTAYSMLSALRKTDMHRKIERGRARTKFHQLSSQRKGPPGFDVNQCKNIAKITLECKGIENFRFHYIALADAHTYRTGGRQPIATPSPPIFSVTSHAQSREVRGPPLPTQFGFAKLYRGCDTC